MVMEMRRFEYACLYLLILLLFFFGNAVSSSVVMSLKIWWNTLIPSMLVPMILIRFLYLRQGFDALGSSFFNRIFHMKNNGIAYVVCPMLLGFPAGSLFIDQAYEEHHLNAEGMRRLLLCCCFPTPGFVILTLGTLYQDIAVGWKLYFCIIIGGCILLFMTRKQIVIPSLSSSHVPSLFSALSDSIWYSVRSMLLIGVYLLLFLSIASILQFFLPSFLILPFQLIAEFSSGVLLCATLSLPIKIKLLITVALLAFGGLCVHLQILSSLQHHPFSYLTFLRYRLLHACFAVLIACIII